jgi:hypothetical protein
LRNTWWRRSSTQQGDEVQGHEPRDSTRAYLNKEVRSRAAGHVVAPEPSSTGRCDLKLQLAWQRMDARHAPYLNLALICGVPGLQSADSGGGDGCFRISRRLATRPSSTQCCATGKQRWDSAISSSGRGRTGWVKSTARSTRETGSRRCDCCGGAWTIEGDGTAAARTRRRRWRRGCQHGARL